MRLLYCLTYNICINATSENNREGFGQYLIKSFSQNHFLKSHTSALLCRSLQNPGMRGVIYSLHQNTVYGSQYRKNCIWEGYDIIQNILKVQWSHLKTKGDLAFSVSAMSLPMHNWSSSSVATFKFCLKTHPYSTAFFYSYYLAVSTKFLGQFICFILSNSTYIFCFFTFKDTFSCLF